jgi:hypothetical protein
MATIVVAGQRYSGAAGVREFRVHDCLERIAADRAGDGHDMPMPLADRLRVRDCVITRQCDRREYQDPEYGQDGVSSTPLICQHVSSSRFNLLQLPRRLLQAV